MFRRIREQLSERHLLIDLTTKDERKLYEKVAKPHEKQDPLFDFLISDSPMESLAADIRRQLTLETTDVNQLIKIHKAKEPILRREKSFAAVYFAALLFVSALILENVPEVVVRRLGIDYAEYQFWGFIVIWAVGLYLGTAILGAWYVLHKTRRQYDFCALLLSYCEILEDGDEAKNLIGRPPKGQPRDED